VMKAGTVYKQHGEPTGADLKSSLGM